MIGCDNIHDMVEQALIVFNKDNSVMSSRYSKIIVNDLLTYCIDYTRETKGSKIKLEELFNVYFIKINRFYDDIIHDIMAGKLTIKEFIKISEVKLFPHLYKKELQKIDTMNNITNDKGETVDIYCPRCGPSQGYQIFVTVASMDESKKTMYKCKQCNR